MVEESDFEAIALKEHTNWMRVHCLRIACQTRPLDTVEKQIEIAMVYEWFVRGEIKPDENAAPAGGVH